MADRRPFSEIMNINTVMEMDAEDDEEKANMFHEPMRRNLLDVFDKTLPPVADERMCVYLRVRPFSPKEIEEGEDQGCVKALNEYMISANAPKDSHTFKSTTYGLGKAKHNFTFSRVFPESTSQKEFFSATMLKLVQDFIEGQNCLVFTYGITNAGKTYTIQGNPKDAGVLPRGLDVLFNSINGKQWPSMDLKPRMFNDVVKLTPEEEEKERKIKELVMKMNSSEDLNVMTLLGEDAVDQSMMNTTSQSNETSSKACSTESQEDILMEVQDRVREETAVDVADQGRIRFSVWVSFAEIYNEQIFDLLEPMPRKNNARRPVLKLSEDRRGSPYIKGLKEINVTSADEAYKLLTIGQRNLKTACTRLNHSSSRSHCIFNIKIIRVADKGNPKFARVSMLSLCDLAGSERQAKTQTTGERLKEAGNINTSLLTLGRCIELLRNNQNHKDNPKIIPFRDSRLTRLFQNFFCGRGKAAMIVNVSQCASMFDETLNVFKFSAIAKQVVLPKPEERPTELYINPKRTTKGFTVRSSSIGWDNSTTPAKRHIPSELADPEEEVDEGSGNDEECYIEFLEARICELEAQIKELKRERMAHEIHIRQEVCKEMQDQFVKIEDMYSTMLKETKQEEEERFEKRLKLLMDNIEPQPSKRIRLEEPSESGGSKTKQNTSVMVDGEDEWVSSLLLYQERIKVQERDASLVEARDEINKLRSEITELQFQTADLLRKNKEHAEKLQKAEEAQKKTEEEATTRIDEIKESRSIVTEKAPKCEDDMGHSVLLETLGQQLQEAKDKLRQQEKEIKDLNEMLVDAGNTFHQKEEEIAKLKSVIAEDEEKMEHQVETIRDLRQLLEESRQTLEESEKKIEAKNHSIGNMKGSCDNSAIPSNSQQKQNLNLFHHTALPVATVIPLCSLAPDSFTSGSVDERDPNQALVELVSNTPSPVIRHRFQPQVCSPSSVVCNSPGLICQSSVIPSTPEFIATKTEKNRVLRVMVTPLEKLVCRHTKTSLLRLKQTPIKVKHSPFNLAETCSKFSRLSCKRKISDIENDANVPVSLKKNSGTVEHKENKLRKGNTKNLLSLSRSKGKIKGRESAICDTNSRKYNLRSRY